MWRLATLLALFTLASGCTTTDPATTRILNDRLSDLEAGRSAGNAAPDGSNYIVIYAKASNGAKIPVKFHQTGPTTFIGPKGEEYDTIPTETQVQKLYGF